jgi:hypothetical protein
MNLSNQHSAKRKAHSENSQLYGGCCYALCALRSANLITMKKLLRLFMLIGVLAVVLALYSFGNAVVCNYALDDIERTIGFIEKALLSLVAVMLIVFIIAWWRDEL